jgi:hypothetical protein
MTGALASDPVDDVTDKRGGHKEDSACNRGGDAFRDPKSDGPSVIGPRMSDGVGANVWPREAGDGSSQAAFGAGEKKVHCAHGLTRQRSRVGHQDPAFGCSSRLLG